MNQWYAALWMVAGNNMEPDVWAAFAQGIAGSYYSFPHSYCDHVFYERRG